MFDVKKVELEWAGKKLQIETGKIARQADSSVIATYGGTTVMAATSEKTVGVNTLLLLAPINWLTSTSSMTKAPKISTFPESPE